MQERNGEGPGVRVAASTVTVAILALWLAFVSINSLRGLIIEAEQLQLLLPRRLAVASVGATLSALICLLLRGVERSSLRVQAWVAGLAAAPAALVFSVANFAVFFLFRPDSDPKRELALYGARRLLLTQVSEGLVSWYFVFAAWGAFYLAMTYARTVGAMERNASVLREQARIAQLSALRYQVNPHFFFNILNSLSTLVMREDRREAERMIADVSGFFRMTLSADPAADTPLEEEVALQRRYLDLEARRFPARLHVVEEIAPALKRLPIPAMILQPLVENAVRHGLGRSNAPVIIAFRARDAGEGMVEMVVEDDACPAEAVSAGSVGGHGIGLANVAGRLEARFGPAAGLAVSRPEGGGFRVTLRIPVGARR